MIKLFKTISIVISYSINLVFFTLSYLSIILILFWLIICVIVKVNFLIVYFIKSLILCSDNYSIISNFINTVLVVIKWVHINWFCLATISHHFILIRRNVVFSLVCDWISFRISFWFLINLMTQWLSLIHIYCFNYSIIIFIRIFSFELFHQINSLINLNI